MKAVLGGPNCNGKPYSKLDPLEKPLSALPFHYGSSSKAPSGAAGSGLGSVQEEARNLLQQ